MSQSKQSATSQQTSNICHQKDLSEVVSCTSLTNLPTNPYFKRSKPFPVRQKRNMWSNLEFPRMTYLSPPKGVKQGQQNNSTFFITKEEKEKNLCQNLKQSNFFNTLQFKSLCRSVLTINQRSPNNPQMKHHNQFGPLREEERQTEPINRELEEENYKLREKLKQLFKEVALLQQQKLEDQVQKKLFIQTKQQLQFKVQSLQEINSCLQDIIDRLNNKIQTLENELQPKTSIYDISEPPGSIDSTNDELMLKNCEIQVDMDFYKEQTSWHEQMIESLQMESQSLKSRVLDLRKQVRHYQFEASLLQKVREQMVEERSKRERLQQKTKFLNQKIISMIKQQRKCPDSPIQYSTFLSDG